MVYAKMVTCRCFQPADVYLFAFARATARWAPQHSRNGNGAILALRGGRWKLTGTCAGKCPFSGRHSFRRPRNRDLPFGRADSLNCSVLAGISTNAIQVIKWETLQHVLSFLLIFAFFLLLLLAVRRG